MGGFADVPAGSVDLIGHEDVVIGHEDVVIGHEDAAIGHEDVEAATTGSTPGPLSRRW
jgi:hypothetical protein